MHVTVAKQPKSTLKLTVELSPVDMQPYLERAAEQLSQRHKIEGFRPGKASLGVVVQKLGPQVVWEEGAELAVRKSFGDAIRQENIPSIGQPKVSVHKLAPDNPFIYHAEVAVLPEVTLGNYKALKSKAEPAVVRPEKIEKTLEDLRQMFAKEQPADRAAQAGDKIEVDFDLFVDHVAIDGGSSKQHPITIGSGNFIPGFEEQLVGLKKGDKKEFSLPFPSDYHNSAVAGKTGTFKVEVKELMQVDLPAFDDDFAKQASKWPTLAELKKQITENLQQEAEHESDVKWERALIEELIGKTKFGDLPELLLKSELDKMIHELQSEVERQGGLKFADYLQGIKKTEENLRQELAPQAERRVKSALILRSLGKAEAVTVPPEEIDREVDQALQTYAQYPDLQAQIQSDDYRDFAEVMLTNRQVMARIKSWAAAKA